MMRIDERQVGGRKLFFDHNRHVLRLRFKAPYARRQVVVIQIEPLGDGLQVFFLDGLAGQNQGERTMVIDDHAPVAVENAAARRQQGHRLDAILLRALVVELRILHLQLPKPGNQEEEDAHCSVLEDGYLTGREAGIVAQRGFIGELYFRIMVNRGQDHSNPRDARSSIILADFAWGVWNFLSAACDGSHTRAGLAGRFAERAGTVGSRNTKQTQFFGEVAAFSVTWVGGSEAAGAASQPRFSTLGRSAPICLMAAMGMRACLNWRSHYQSNRGSGNFSGNWVGITEKVEWICLG